MTTITILNDVILPEIVMAAGVRGRQIRKNERTQTINGSVEVNVQWDYTLREFEVGYIPMLPQAWAAIEGLFEVTDAGAYGFLMLDPKDSGVSAAQGKLIAYNDGFPVGAIGTGYGEPVHHLFKRYTSGGQTWVRTIAKPVAGTVRVALGMVEQMSGWTVDTTTGVVTFTTAPAGGVAVRAGFEFDVPVRFDSDTLDVTLDFERLGSITSIPLLEIRR